MSGRIPILIDTDPGVDDALAVLMACSDARHELLALTVTAGNVGLQHTLRNALALRDIAGRPDLPVHAGCTGPLLHPSPDAAEVHGADGFGDAGLPAPAGQPDSLHAALAILAAARAHADRLLLVTLGPLGNLALALRLDPDLPQRINRLVVMGGAVEARGNITPVAEFNVAFDPEAARIVFEAFPMAEVCDWQATLAHGLAQADVARWLLADSPRARFFDAISRKTRAWSAQRRGERWYCADALAMAFALHPGAAAEVAERPLEVVLEHGPARGMTAVDWNRQLGRRDNARILRRFDQARFEGLVQAALEAG